MTKLLTVSQLDLAAEMLIKRGIVAFPTETVYGLGVVYDDFKAFERMVDVKQRRAEQPFTLMCAYTKDIAKYAYINKTAQKIIDEFLPGELTIILKVKENVPQHVTLGTEYVGIRVSANLLVANLINLVGKPLLVPSANKRGDKPAITQNEVINIFDGEIDGVIEGETLSHIPSTIIKVSDKIELIREGAIPFSNILSIIKEED